MSSGSFEAETRAPDRRSGSLGLSRPSLREALRTIWTRAVTFRSLWFALALTLGLEPRRGADFPRYEQWAEAFSSSNIFKIKSVVVSPSGVPFSQWSHAPGLVTSALDSVLAFVPFLKTGIHVASWLAALAFWWALIGIARIVSKGDAAVFALTLASAFVGTHAGFYSIYHSSESFALASFTVAVYWALSAAPNRPLDSLVLGVACGLLLTIRVNLVMYVPLPLAIRAFIVWRGRGEVSHAQLSWHAVALGVPLLAFATQLPVFNYWMTGEPTHSPYVYGDDEFRSVDLSRPLLGATLTHAWHGLLTYHPLWGVGACALGALTLRRSLPRAERALAAVASLALSAHLYLQASWWCWWLGTATFGNRTLALGGVVGVIALAKWLQLLFDGSARRGERIAGVALLVLVIASCAWSFLLCLQGHSNFHRWQELLAGQRAVLLNPPVLVPATVLCVLGVGVGLGARRRWPGRAALIAAASAVSGLALYASLAVPFTAELETPAELDALAVVELGALSALGFVVLVHLVSASAVPKPALLPRRVVAGALCWILVSGSWAFVKLFRATNEVIANGTASTRSFRYRSSLSIDDMLDSVREYQAVEGFRHRKLVAKRFITAKAEEQSLFKPEKTRPERGKSKKKRPRRKG